MPGKNGVCGTPTPTTTLPIPPLRAAGRMLSIYMSDQLQFHQRGMRRTGLIVVPLDDSCAARLMSESG